MIVREVADTDLAWLPGYVLGGMNTTGFTPSLPAIHTMIARCREHRLAYVAENGSGPVGCLGAIIQPSFWAQESEINVVALRSTYPGAGLALIRKLLSEARTTFVGHVVVTVENDDERLAAAMRAMGSRRTLQSFVFQFQE